MLNQEKQLIESLLQLFVLLDALFDEFTPEYVDICFNLAIDGTFTSIKCDSQVVEGLLLEALIGCEGRHNFSRHHMENRCQEVIKADEVILISIQKVHIVHRFHLNVHASEVKLFTSQQN